MLFALPFRPEFSLFAINLGVEDFSCVKLWVRELPYRQPSQLRQVLGYLIPDDASEQNNVPSKIVMMYIGRGPEIHGHPRIFCSYVTVQLHYGVYVSISL
jgi:hypothetical protein